MKTQLIIAGAIALAIHGGYASAQAAAPPAAAPAPPAQAAPAAPPMSSAPPAQAESAAPAPTVSIPPPNASVPRDAQGNALPPNTTQPPSTIGGSGTAVGAAGTPGSSSIGAKPLAFDVLDTDKAGTLTMSQVRANPWLARHYEDCDTNHNEEITKKEYEDCAAKVR